MAKHLSELWAVGRENNNCEPVRGLWRARAHRRVAQRVAFVVAALAFGCIPFAVAPSSSDMLGVWWKIVEACSGQKADIEAWTFAVSHDTVIHIYAWPYGMVDAWGNTELGSHVIVLSARGAACPKIVRHEMLHAIDPRYDATHPESIYVKCKGIVAPPFTDARDC